MVFFFLLDLRIAWVTHHTSAVDKLRLRVLQIGKLFPGLAILKSFAKTRIDSISHIPSLSKKGFPLGKEMGGSQILGPSKQMWVVREIEVKTQFDRDHVQSISANSKKFEPGYFFFDPGFPVLWIVPNPDHPHYAFYFSCGISSLLHDASATKFSTSVSLANTRCT